MRRTQYIILLCTMLLPFAFTSCEEATDWELKPDGESRLVVEAILTDEFKRQEIRLSKSFSSPNGESPTVSDALVAVEANGTIYGFWPDPTRPGTYISDPPFAVVDNLTYNLYIEWEENIYTASSELSEVAPIPFVTYNREAGPDSLSLGNFVPIYNPNQQAMYEVIVDWAHLSNEGPTRAKMYFYTFSALHINELIRPKREIVRFPKWSIVLIRKYGLNDDFASFLLSMAIETDWNGAFYYTPSGELPTNISNGAYGFFSTCAVVADTLLAF